jgi:trehalose synthase
MVNSTSQGGGVSEMLPAQIRLLRLLGVKVEWLVMEVNEPDFFVLTKRIHNLIHNAGDTDFRENDRTIYEKVNAENYKHLKTYLKEGDILVIHDPQPLGMVQHVKNDFEKVNVIWRSHIGLDKRTKKTRAAYEFLGPYLDLCDHFVFTAPEYIPRKITGNVSIITPAIDPLSHKNRNMAIHKIAGILSCAGLVSDGHPVVAKPFDHPVHRIQPNGRMEVATYPNDIGFLFRPIITEISRWDRLKGWMPLLKGFIKLKTNMDSYSKVGDMHRDRLLAARLVLAGPDPAYIQDDPEGKEVLAELIGAYKKLPESISRDIAILFLPMESRKENALIVNAIQRCSSVVVQNSLQEGFGLTATEAMWKKKPLLGTHAVGLRKQIRDGLDGCLIDNPLDTDEISEKLNFMLSEPKEREKWGFNAEIRVVENFLIFKQMNNWLTAFSEVSSSS